LLLDLRLHELYEQVDRFVIIEANITHQSKRKKQNFDISNFKKFKKKIQYFFIEDIKPTENSWSIENQQRNKINLGLSNLSQDDYVMISDLDEIPNSKKLQQIKKNKYSVFLQKFYYYKFNLINNIEPNWFGTKACKLKYLPSPQKLRQLKIYPWWRLDKKFIKVINDGGWHFSYLMNEEAIAQKIMAFAHKEYNKEIFTDTTLIKKKIDNKKDLFDRNFTFSKMKLDQTFPEFLLKNKELYKTFIED